MSARTAAVPVDFFGTVIHDILHHIFGMLKVKDLLPLLPVNRASNEVVWVLKQTLKSKLSALQSYPFSLKLMTLHMEHTLIRNCMEIGNVEMDWSEHRVNAVARKALPRPQPDR